MSSEMTADRVRELLNYDPLTGVFTWRVGRPGCRAGSVAGCPDGKGYLRIGLDRRLYGAHRLAWIYIYGAWPEDEVDHINRIRTDNRIANLREATTSENQQNTKVRSNNTSGFRGVSFREDSGRWLAKITLNGTKIHLGLFSTREEAATAYEMEAAKLHTHRHSAAIRARGQKEGA